MNRKTYTQRSKTEIVCMEYPDNLVLEAAGLSSKLVGRALIVRLPDSNIRISFHVEGNQYPQIIMRVYDRETTEQYMIRILTGDEMKLQNIMILIRQIHAWGVDNRLCTRAGYSLGRRSQKVMEINTAC